jgi:diguanylate cyclase (GGDEF)-like protein/PAS domain S-box-containing protein
MRITEKNTSTERLIQQSIMNHPLSMFVLLKSEDGANYTVAFANDLARSFFCKTDITTPTAFFDDFWIPLSLNFDTLQRRPATKVSINHTFNGMSYHFEVLMLSILTDGLDEYLLLEISERSDLQESRELLIELQDKYQSVIDHNLDPIISIDPTYKMLNSNEAVYRTFGYRLKELSGRSLLTIVKEEEASSIKTLLERAFLGESVAIEGFSFSHKKGTYLPTHLKLIPIVIDGVIKEVQLIVRDTSDHVNHTEKLHYLSYHDHLTGLWNRRAMKEHFVEDSSSSKNGNEKLVYIHLGLDRFKLINESIGHTGADEILKMVAERLKLICPAPCKLYRNGGDEFIVSLFDKSFYETEKLAQRLLNDFRVPFYFDHQEYFISGSIGIAVHPEDGSTLEELLRKSEHALSFVKQRGRSHYRFYQEEMNSSFPDEALMESHLRRAIEFNELSIHYQPQVDLQTGAISSFEALLRWNNRKFGFVSPAQFIPIAEESGLIHSIGEWVLNEVCLQLKEWQQKQFRPVRIAVNISPKQFRVENFAEMMQAKIINFGILPSSLEVEITESALTVMEETLLILNDLKKIGVFISVDDFGTGYSSLSYLKQYPIDIIKIDRSFITDIEFDEKNAAIAKTIINLAHNLGMQVIAEGVEKDQQAEILLKANCQKAQGFLYSKAIPVDQIVEKYLNKLS